MATEDISGFSLDSLLNDLDEAVKYSPKSFYHNTNIESNITAHTTKFIPHPPVLSHSQNPNPKTKFAVAVDRNCNIESHLNESNNNNSSFSPIKLSLVNNENGKLDKDENSLDNLLNLLNSPQHNNNYSNNKLDNNINYSTNSNSMKTSFFKPNNNNCSIISNLDTSTANNTIQFNFDSVKESEKAFASLGFSTSLECLNSTSTSLATSNVTKSVLNVSLPSNNDHNSTHNNHNSTPNNHNTNHQNNSLSNNSFENQSSNNDMGRFEAAKSPFSNISSPFDSPNSYEGGSEVVREHRKISYSKNNNSNNSNCTSFTINKLQSVLSNNNSTLQSLSNNNNNNNSYNNNSSTSNSQNVKRIITNSNTVNNSNGDNIITPRIGGTLLIPSKQLQLPNFNSYDTNNINNNTNSNTNTATITSFQDITKKNTIKEDRNFLPAKIGFKNIDSNKINNSNTSRARCIKVVIADSMMDRGRKTSSFTRLACDNLRCIKCNFKVHCFLNNSWNDSVDYMFLRNTVPNEQKLSLRLIVPIDDIAIIDDNTITTTYTTRAAAYCCQCTSINAKENNEIELNPTNSTGPQWVCAGH